MTPRKIKATVKFLPSSTQAFDDQPVVMQFPQFPKFPAELRLKIWEYALPKPQYVRTDILRCFSLLKACKESREAVLSKYKEYLHPMVYSEDIGTIVLKKSKIWFNGVHDTVLLQGKAELELHLPYSRRLHTHSDGIQKLAVPYGMTLVMSTIRWSRLWSNFPALRELQLQIGPIKWNSVDASIGTTVEIVMLKADGTLQLLDKSLFVGFFGGPFNIDNDVRRVMGHITIAIDTFKKGNKGWKQPVVLLTAVNLT